MQPSELNTEAVWGLLRGYTSKAVDLFFDHGAALQTRYLVLSDDLTEVKVYQRVVDSPDQLVARVSVDSDTAYDVEQTLWHIKEYH